MRDRPLLRFRPSLPLLGTCLYHQNWAGGRFVPTNKQQQPAVLPRTSVTWSSHEEPLVASKAVGSTVPCRVLGWKRSLWEGTSGLGSDERQSCPWVLDTTVLPLTTTTSPRCLTDTLSQEGCPPSGRPSLLCLVQQAAFGWNGVGQLAGLSCVLPLGMTLDVGL